MSVAPRTLLLALLVLCSGVAAAGSSGSPDIEDPAFDLTTDRVWGIPAPEVDLRAVWWTVEDGTARVSFRVEDLSQRTLVDEALHYGLRGWNQEYRRVAVEAHYLPNFPGQWLFVVSGCNEGPCDSLIVEGSVDEAANVVSVAFPASFLKSDVECTVASTILMARAGLGRYWGGGPFWLRDHAPDGPCGPTFRLTTG